MDGEAPKFTDKIDDETRRMKREAAIRQKEAEHELCLTLTLESSSCCLLAPRAQLHAREDIVVSGANGESATVGELQVRDVVHDLRECPRDLRVLLRRDEREAAAISDRLHLDRGARS